MATKITFNGQSYDGLDAMPADVRTRYQAIVDALGADDREKLESAMDGGAGLRINTTVRRRIRINGKDYDSVEQMPAHEREIYEKAMAKQEAGTAAAAAPEAMPSPPPAIDADDGRRATIVRVALLVLAAVAIVLWLLTRR